MAKIFISTNEITQQEVNRSAELACDGIHFIGENSPTVTNWAPLIDINKDHFIVEDGAIDRNWLFQAPGYPPPRRLDFNKNMAEAAGFRVDSSMVYVEYPRTMLDPLDIVDAAQILGTKVMLLARMFTDWDNTKQRVIDALRYEQTRGIIFELTPSAANLVSLKIPAGVKEVLAWDKRCSLLLPPEINTTRYEYRIKDIVNKLKTYSWYYNPRFSIILACYRRSETTVNFFGKHNSIFAALRWLKKNG